MAHHLTKVKVLRNTNYRASGPGSYVFMMQRYGKHGMKPTMPGPFQHKAQKVVKKAADGTEGEVYEPSCLSRSLTSTPPTFLPISNPELELIPLIAKLRTSRTIPATCAQCKLVPLLRP